MIEKSPPIMLLKQVTKRFRKFAAVNDISFEVEAGEIVGFVGENGAGKTTTINMLLGFTSPTRGELQVFGKSITPSTAHGSHREIGYAAGDMELPSHMTGKQYIRFVLAQSKGKHVKRYDELVKDFNPQLNKRISSLSRGNKQKIALIAAFVSEPKLIVLDEPTSGLDPVMQEVFLSTVRQEAARGTTIFMSSHYLREVTEVCTRVLLMKDGRIVEDLSAAQLAEKGGKNVTVTTREELAPPEYATLLNSSVNGGVHTLTFSYTRDVTSLLEWIAGLHEVLDIEINERTLEEEFKHIYSHDEEKADE